MRAAFPLVALLCACSPPGLVVGDRAFAQGRYPAAAEAYGHDDEAAPDALLFRDALLAVTPQSPQYDPAKARALLERLAREHPSTVHGAAATQALRWLAERDALRARVQEAEVRLAECAAEGQRADAQHQQELKALRDNLAALDAERQHLQAELRATHDGPPPGERVQTLQDENTRLKNEIDEIKRIDLRR